jgi:hypothetical protein
MSKVAIQGAATGTGVFTLASPATNTDRTLTLPDEAGTVLTTAGVPASAMPAGSVIQVVSANDSANTITSSTSFVNTGLTVTITPTSSTSKIYVVATGGLDNSNTGNYGYATITRNGLNLGHVNHGFSTIRSTARSLAPWAASFLDSPATTSALTYTVQIRADSGTIEFPGTFQTKTITVMEIAA